LLENQGPKTPVILRRTRGAFAHRLGSKNCCDGLSLLNDSPPGKKIALQH